MTPSPRFMPRRLGHANMVVSDLKRSTKFYTEIAGIEEVFEEHGIGANFLSNGNSHHDVALMQATSQPLIGIGGHVQGAAFSVLKPGLNHFGWEVDNEADLVAAWRRAVKAKVPIDTTSNHQVAHSVYLYDPDGNYHEFYADISHDWRKVFNLDHNDLITSHWDPEAAEPTKEPFWQNRPDIRKVDGALFNPTRTARAVLVAKDFDRLKEFFVEVAGLQPISDVNSKEYVIFRGTATNDEWHLALFAPNDGLRPGLHHVVLEIPREDDLLSAEKRAGKSGTKIEKILDRPNKRSIFMRDPDNLLLEFRYTRSNPAVSLEKVPTEMRAYAV